MGKLSVSGQEVTFGTSQFYYNPFDNNNLGVFNNYLDPANKTIITTPTSATTFNGTIALTSVPGVNSQNNIYGQIVTTNNERNLNNYDYEWTFLYKNNSSISPVEPYDNGQRTANPGSGNAAWQYWLNATDKDQTSKNIQGFYITHVGNNMILRYRASEWDTRSLITFPVSNNALWTIKIQRLNTGRWRIWANPVSGLNYEATNYIDQVDLGDVNTYSYSILATNDQRPAGNNFYWDNLKMYTRKMTINGLNTPVNGITQPPYTAGQLNVAITGLQLNIRGTYSIADINFSTSNTSANLNAYLTNGRLYKSIDDDYNTTYDNSLLKSPVNDMSGNLVQSGTINDINYSSGNSDGSLTRVGAYFLVVDILANLNYGSGPPYGSIQFTGPSQIRTTDYINPTIGGYINNATTGNNVITFSFIYTWTGNTSSYWMETGNWVGNKVPPADGSADIIIPSTGVTNEAISQKFSYNQDINKIYPKTLTIANNRTLTILNGDNLQIVKSLLAEGTIKFGNSNKLYSSDNADANTTFTLDAGATALLNNLIIDKYSLSKTVILNSSGTAALVLTGTLNAKTGTLSVNNNALILRSNSNGTASVSQLSPDAKITGNVTVERYITGGSASNRSWRLMSSPVNNNNTIPLSNSASYDFSSLKKNILVTGPGGSSNGFDPSPTNGPTILLYNTATKLFEVPGSITTTAKVGRGFYFYFRGDNINNTLAKVTKAATAPYYPTPEANIVALQTGALNQQNFTYGLTIGGNGWNQAGNPYPSTININPASGSGVLTNTTPFIYTYNSGGNSINAQSASTNIASGQGFFVKVATGATSASINFTESLKTSAQPTGPSLLMGKPVGTQEPIISLKMTHDSVNYDISHLRFLDNYKKEYDEMEDADKLNGQGQTVFFSAITSDNRQVAIASQPLDKQKTSIFLSVNDNTGGLVSISKMNLTGIPEVYDVWLMDHFKNDSLDIRANDNYNFNIDRTNPATYGNARFEVVIRKKSLPPYQLTSFTGARKGADVAINWNTKNEYNYTEFEVQKSTDGVNFNAVKNMQSSSMGSYTYKDIETNPTTGNIYYRLKQVDINDKIYYSDVIIISTQGSGTFNVFPNPATNVIQFSLSQPVKSSVQLTIYNTMGVLMKSTSFTSNTGQQDISNLTPGTYTIQITDRDSKKSVLSGKFIKL